MTRVKRGTTANKRRKNLLKRTKGFLYGGHSKYRAAKERLVKADYNAYKSRRLRKREFRRLWITRINGALDQIGSELSYSHFMNLLKKSDLELNRKSIAEIAMRDLDEFKKIVEKISK